MLVDLDSKLTLHRVKTDYGLEGNRPVPDADGHQHIILEAGTISQRINKRGISLLLFASLYRPTRWSFHFCLRFIPGSLTIWFAGNSEMQSARG